MVESSPAALTVRANNCRCRAAFHGSPACNSNGSRGRPAGSGQAQVCRQGGGDRQCRVRHLLLTAAFFAARHQDTRWSAPIQQILDGEFHDLTVAGARLGLDPDQAVKIIAKFGPPSRPTLRPPHWAGSHYLLERRRQWLSGHCATTADWPQPGGPGQRGGSMPPPEPL